jgi:hypothetical protein
VTGHCHQRSPGHRSASSGFRWWPTSCPCTTARSPSSVMCPIRRASGCRTSLRACTRRSSPVRPVRRVRAQAARSIRPGRYSSRRSRRRPSASGSSPTRCWPPSSWPRSSPSRRTASAGSRDGARASGRSWGRC